MILSAQLVGSVAERAKAQFLWRLVIVLNHIWNHLGYQWSRGFHYSVLYFT